ncbi:MAG: hypothetical protein ACOYLQ_01930 [Hyphomicrobiaceae bacterium]
MNHRHRKVLTALFAHPVSAEIDNRSGSRVGVTLKGHTVVFHHANHSVPKDEVAQIRKFLIDCGISPEQFPALPSLIG